MASNLFSDSPYMKRIVSMAQGANAGITFIPCQFCQMYVQVKNLYDNICKRCVKRIMKHGYPKKCRKCKLQKVFGAKLYCIQCAMGFYRAGMNVCQICHDIISHTRSPFLVEEHCVRCLSPQDNKIHL